MVSLNIALRKINLKEKEKTKCLFGLIEKHYGGYI